MPHMGSHFYLSRQTAIFGFHFSFDENKRGFVYINDQNKTAVLTLIFLQFFYDFVELIFVLGPRTVLAARKRKFFI